MPSGMHGIDRLLATVFHPLVFYWDTRRSVMGSQQHRLSAVLLVLSGGDICSIPECLYDANYSKLRGASWHGSISAEGSPVLCPLFQVSCLTL